MLCRERRPRRFDSEEFVFEEKAFVSSLRKTFLK